MSSQYCPGQIEILETRIAPATIFVGHIAPVGDPQNPAFNDSEYKEPPGPIGTDDDPAFPNRFFDTDAGVADPISAVVGTGAVGPDTFYLKLSKGDSVMRFTDAGYVPFITGLGGLDSSGKPVPISGNVIAFFVDKNLNNEVDENELTGLSLGKDVSVEISGNVDGDIVSNFNDATSALGGAAEAGTPFAVDLLLNPIKALVVNGNVAGALVSGGTINQTKIVGSIEEVLTGKAANGFQYNFLSAAAAGDGGDTLAVVPGAGVKGVGITNTTIGALDKPGPGASKVGRLETGGGGAGAEGGSIFNLTIVSDTTGFQILAGAGGDGIAGKPNGGPGGKLTKIYVNGLDENQGDDPQKNDPIEIRGGNGGDGLGGVASKGGIAGGLTEVYVGYEVLEGKFKISTNALQDTVIIAGGIGGDGKIGEAGGSLNNVNVVANPSGAGNNIQILGGLGGANIVAAAGGKAGAGGKLSRVDVQNPPQDPATFAATKLSTIVIKGGDGGATMAGFGAGAAGGGITDARTVGFTVDIRGGNGSSGVSGGLGGDLRTVILDEGFVVVRAENAIIDAGAGGSGSVTKGANGGSIATLKVKNSDLKTFLVNMTAGAANGGNSNKGPGANGGSLSDFDVVDVDSVPDPTPNNEVNMQVRAGNGGNGGGGNGGNGGNFTGDNTIFATDANLTLTAGAGGNAGGKGNGGSGGIATGFGYFGVGSVLGLPGTVTVTGGKGGDGAVAGAGGPGGTLRDLSLNTDGSVTAVAGAGGVAGVTGAAGRGGDLVIFSGLSRTSSMSLTAGDAGTGGVKIGAGGTIGNASLRAATSIFVEAGDGRNGGAGGGVNGLSFTNEAGDTSPAAAGLPVAGPLGPVTITGGAGSAALKAAGNGGGLSDISGVIAVTGLTDLRAGAVVVTAGATKSSNGGSISDVNLFGGGGIGAEVRIEAGDAADVPDAKKGGNGGTVKEVYIGDVFQPSVIDPATVIQRIVAGDGGDVTIAKGIGGTGGNVLDVRVGEDIGRRSGSAFGYATMGGVFAGAAGTSGAGGKVALAGNVIGISADAIASIVAGKPVNGDAITRRNLVQTVDAIVLNGNVASLTNANGSYLNFGTANIVGGVVNPTAVGVAYPATHPHANTFDLIVQGSAVDEYGDVDANQVFSIGDTTNANTDGFVAAVNYVNNTSTPNNVRFEALLTLNAAGASVFIDLDNTNGQQHL